MTKSEALDIATAYLGQQLRSKLNDKVSKRRAPIIEGWPRHTYGDQDEPVWSLFVPEAETFVGGSRVLVISQRTGQVLFDGRCGE